jgi:hypothetical protein
MEIGIIDIDWHNKVQKQLGWAVERTVKKYQTVKALGRRADGEANG